MIARHFFVPACLLAAALHASAAQSADVSQLGLTPAQAEALNAQLTAPVTAPGLSFGSPVAFGAAWGEAFVAVGGQTDDGGSHGVDGSASLGFGLGDDRSSVGLEMAITAISLRDSFGEDGDVSWKLHRSLPGRVSVAVGVDNTGRWGAARGTKAGSYLVATKVFELAPDSARNPMPVSFNVGVGNGRFLAPGDNGINGFGSLAIAPWRRVSLVADYTGRDFNFGISAIPFPRLPVVLTAGAINLGQRYGRDTEFAGGIGYRYSF